MAAVPLRGRRGALGPGAAGEPECKRACRLLEPIPREVPAQLWGRAMELPPGHRDPPEPKGKQNVLILENHGSKGTAQPCPRCAAGESGHFRHILDS